MRWRLCTVSADYYPVSADRDEWHVAIIINQTSDWGEDNVGVNAPLILRDVRFAADSGGNLVEVTRVETEPDGVPPLGSEEKKMVMGLVMAAWSLVRLKKGRTDVTLTNGVYDDT